MIAIQCIMLQYTIQHFEIEREDFYCLPFYFCRACANIERKLSDVAGLELLIETERLHLRLPITQDAEIISKLANNINIASMVATVKHPYTLSDAEQWLKQTSDNHDNLLHITFIISLVHNKAVIGTCGASHMKQQTYGLGYWIGEDYWNNGYATEAVTALRDFLIKKREAKFLGAWYANENIASKRVLEKSGFKYRGKQMDIHSLGRGCDVPCSLMEMDVKKDDFSR